MECSISNVCAQLLHYIVKLKFGEYSTIIFIKYKVDQINIFRRYIFIDDPDEMLIKIISC